MLMRILLVFIGAFFLKVKAEKCAINLHHLAGKQAIFIRCSTTHSVPFTVCSNCKKVFDDVSNQYQVLSEDKNCTNKYFDKDRINIISTTQSIVTGLWNSAFCADCYSNITLILRSKEDDFQNCLNDTSIYKVDACEKCLPRYIDLNNFYKKNITNKDALCFDLQDKMNRSRSTWSKDLNCGKIEHDIFAFVVVSAVVASLPVAFYVSLLSYAKRNERNHQRLTSGYSRVESATHNLPSTSFSSGHVSNESNQLNLSLNKNEVMNDSESCTSDDDDSILTKIPQPPVDEGRPLIKL